MAMRILRETTFLVVLLAIIITGAYIPYHINENQIHTNHRILKVLSKEEDYDCKLNAIFRLFTQTAANTRFLLADRANVDPETKRINLHAGKIYTQVHKALNNLVPIRCTKEG